MKRREKEDNFDYTVQVPELCKRRLLGYAQVFRELSKSLNGEFLYASDNRQGLLEAKALWENRQIVCTNMNEMAEIMSKVAYEVFRYEPMEEKKRKMLIHALKQEDINVTNPAYVIQENDRQAIGMDLCTNQKRGIPAEDVADMISVLLNRRLVVSVTSPYFVEQESKSFIFVDEPKYLVLTGFAKATKENEEVSGDNYVITESEKGKLTILLSDGTGSGATAADNSEEVLELMEKMIEACYGMDTAVNMVNLAVFTNGQDGNHPTLDICDVDLYDGGCDFYKIGGVTSFIKRAKSVEAITMGTLPLGIFQNVEPEQQSRLLRDGDYCILVTDGVLEALGECDYEQKMCEFISCLEEQNPTQMAEKLLHLVLCASGGHIKDDMTIIVMGMWENSCIS